MRHHSTPAFTMGILFTETCPIYNVFFIIIPCLSYIWTIKYNLISVIVYDALMQNIVKMPYEVNTLYNYYIEWAVYLHGLTIVSMCIAIY